MGAEKGGRKYWVGFDLGGTKMMAGVFDSAFRRVGLSRKRTKAYVGAGGGVNRILDLMKAAMDEAKISPTEVAGIGVGVPGPLDLKRGVVLQMPNLGWGKVPLQKKIEKKFGCSVVLANDVDAGTYGEYLFGAGRGARCLLGVFPGTGIGGACVYEGQIFRGAGRSCLEIGHLRVVPGGPLCGCGRRGCLEAVASRLAIATQTVAAIHRGEAPHLAAHVGTDLSEIRSGVLKEAIQKGDRVIERILRDAAAQLGSAIASMVNLLAPDVIVLGGGLAEAFPDLYRTECSRVVAEEVMASFRGTYRIAIAKLGDDATIVGAAALAANPGAIELSVQRAKGSR
jgi:glucokinase